MAQSELNVSNLALRLMGNRAVLTALSDTSVEGLACNAMVDDCKKALLRMSPWNFATKRDVLEVTEKTITLLTPSGGEQTILDVAAHGFTLGQWIQVGTEGGSVPGLDGGPHEISVIVGAGQLGIYLPFTDIDASDFGGSGVTTSCWLSNAFGYVYKLALPTDLLRVLAINEDNSGEPWRIEGRFLLTDSSEARIRYIYDVTDYTTMDADFYQALAHYLAYNLCDHLSASDQKKNELHTYLYGGQGKRGILPQSRFVDATEDSQQEMEANDWILSRGSVSNAMNLGN